jgi:hypothetical protein
MAVAVTTQDVQVADSTATFTSCTVTPSGTNRFMMIFLSWFDAPGPFTLSTLTVDGVSAIANVRHSSLITGASRAIASYYFIAPPASSISVAATLSGSTSDLLMGVTCFSGVHQSSPFGGTVDVSSSDSGGASADPELAVNEGSATGMLYSAGTFAVATVTSVSDDSHWYQAEWVGNGRSGISQTTTGATSDTHIYHLPSSVAYGIIGDAIMPVAAATSGVEWLAPNVSLSSHWAPTIVQMRTMVGPMPWTLTLAPTVPDRLDWIQTGVDVVWL